MKVACPALTQEASSFGAAIAGGIGVGIFKNFEIVHDLLHIVDVRYPREKLHSSYNRLYPIFKTAYRQTRTVFEDLAAF